MLRIGPVLSLASVALCAGCADPVPPVADPAKVERLLASIDEQPRLAGPVIAAGKVEEKIAKADRISGALAKVQTERIDPSAVVALVSR